MRTIKDEMGIWQNESLTTLRSIELIPIAYFYAERGHEKDAFFCDFTNWPLSGLTKIFLVIFFYFYKLKMWNVAADDMPLKWCKRNWYNTNGHQKKWKDFLYAFLFLSGIYSFKIQEPLAAITKICNARALIWPTTSSTSQQHHNWSYTWKRGARATLSIK